MKEWVVLKRTFELLVLTAHLLGAGVLGDGLGALRHGVLGQLTGEQQAHGGLDLPGADGTALVVVRQARGLSGNALEDIIDEGVHDSHGLGGDAGVGVDLFQDFVDVDSVGLLPGLSALLAALSSALGDGFLGALLGRGFWCGVRHFEALVASQ